MYINIHNGVVKRNVYKTFNVMVLMMSIHTVCTFDFNG